MLNIIAAVVDHAITRILLAVLGLGVTFVFGTFSVILLVTNYMPGESVFDFLVGLGGCLGMVGWWARLFIRSATLAKRRGVRNALIVCLAAGTGAAVAGTTMFPRDTPGQFVLWLMAGTGILLLTGSLGTAGPGPGDSSKPTALRGAA